MGKRTEGGGGAIVPVAGGGVALQEVNQEEQGGALQQDGWEQGEWIEGAQQGEAEGAGGLSAPLLPPAGRWHLLVLD